MRLSLLAFLFLKYFEYFKEMENGMAEEEPKKKKHNEWRKEVKKLRRKKIRQRIAEERNQLAQKEESARLNNPNYIKWLREQEELETLELEQEECRRQEEEELWLRRELLARKIFREQQIKQEATAAIKEAERLRIQKEFELLQKKAEQRREERKQREEQAKRDYEEMMQKIFDYIELGGTIPEELKSNVESNPNKPVCPFFLKTSACRYGMHCKRNHIRPKLSRIIFIPNFFTHIKLEHGGTSHGNDINLECSEDELNKDYKVFFEDVIEELKKFGKMLYFRTCMNTQSHLRGNVFVEYNSERDALKAFAELQGRYYAGRQINVEFAAISSWRSSICGLFDTNNCPKGRDCNFLHIFTNPGYLFANHAYNSERDESKNKTRPRENSIMSWNDDNDNGSRRNWRWTESPERNWRKNKHQSKSKEDRERNRNNSGDRYRSRKRSHGDYDKKRDKSVSKHRNSSRSSRHSSDRVSSSTSLKKERNVSNSKSPLSSRKHHKHNYRENHHTDKNYKSN